MPWPPSCVLGLLARIDEEADRAPTDLLVLVQAGAEGEPVHLHRHLAGFEGVEAFLHVGVGVAWRRAALVERLVGFEPLNGVGRIHEALHPVGLLRILVLEAKGIERQLVTPIVMPSEPRSV